MLMIDKFTVIAVIGCRWG